MGKGPLSDGRWLSAFQGRLINFEKRRKVSGCIRPCWQGCGNQRPALAAPCFPFYLWGELDPQKRGVGTTPKGGGVQEARGKDSFLGGTVCENREDLGRKERGGEDPGPLGPCPAQHPSP